MTWTPSARDGGFIPPGLASIKNNEFMLADGRIAFFDHIKNRWLAMAAPYNRESAEPMPEGWAPLGRND